MKKYTLKTFTRNTLLLVSTVLLATNAAKADEIDDFIASKMAEKQIPGLQLAIVKDSKIIKTSHYGYSNLQHQVKVTPQTLFPINSMTKAFTGIAIMQLAEQDKLKLDDPIGRHLSDIPKHWKQLTIRQLISHTSGLPHILGDMAELIPAKSPQDAYDQVTRMPMLFEPDTKFKYNQTGYVLLGKIIDKLSGQPFTQYIIEQQLNKVGMPLTAQAGFAQTQYIVANQSRQYFKGRSGQLENYNGGYAPMLRTAAGMSANAAELAKFMIALNQGKVFEKTDSVKKLWTANRLNNGQTAGFNSRENGYAQGWQTWARDEHPAVSASGGNASSMVYYPQDGLGIIVLTNRLNSGPADFIDEIAGFFYPEMKRANGWGIPVAIFKLQKLLERQGFQQGIELTESLKAQGYQFNAGQMNAWGYEYVGKNQLRQALEIFKINVHLFPEIANAHDSLAETYLALGNKDKAREYYQKVLTLKPKNRHAQRQLEKIASL